jgi:phosphoribosylpyrophosphate synthetase
MSLGSTYPVGWDSRGNRLRGFRVQTTASRDPVWALLRCCSDVAEHLEETLAHLGATRSRDVDQSLWTHKVQWTGPYRSWQKKLLEVLEEALLVPAGADVDFVLALDFYKTPPDPENGQDEWGWTEAGELIYRGKYWNDVNAQKAAGRDLSDRLADVVRRHRLLAHADVVVSVPGTQHLFGERLAKSVAARSNKPLVRSLRKGPAHAPAKQGHADDQLEAYSIDASVNGKAVIIVDDVYRSGITMRSVASAARTAGATAVYGLVGARTMRKS